MEKNKVIEKLEEIIGSDATTFVCGSIIDSGTERCSLTEHCGSVYGIAIKLDNESEKKLLFDAVKDNKDAKENFEINNWKTIGDNFYPLYWGKDEYMGSRLTAHTKKRDTTGVIQLPNKKYLQNKTIIYGVVECTNYDKHEKTIIEEFPCIFKVKKNQ